MLSGRFYFCLIVSRETKQEHLVFFSGKILQMNCQKVCKPGSVSIFQEDNHSSRRGITAPLMQPTRTTGGKHAYMPFLFGLASSGVYHAVPVTDHAVRSYRTLSPFPLKEVVCSLLHFPLARATRVLPGTVFS